MLTEHEKELKRISNHRPEIQERKRAYQNLDRKLHPEKRRYWRRSIQFTDAQFHAMYIDQNGCCLMCGVQKEENAVGLKYRLVPDHDHATGIVRGLLCATCNLIVGYAEMGIKRRPTDYWQWICQYLERGKKMHNGSSRL